MPVPTSQNGYPANNRDLTMQWTIPGTVRKINLSKGDPGFLLCHFAAWFDKNIEDIEEGQLDDWGYAERPIRGGTELSNHASGTAIDINAVKHPLGAVNTFTQAQRDKIRAKLKDYEGVIRWGGDYTGRKDEMHFEVNASLAKVESVAAKIRSNPSPTTPSSNVKDHHMLIAKDVAPNRNGGWRCPVPTGKASLITSRAWFNAVVNGPSKGRLRIWCQSRSSGIWDSGSTLIDIGFKDGLSSIYNVELPDGTSQINVWYDFPEGGNFLVEMQGK